MLIECPYCKGLILIEQINCKIFRHAVNKHTFEQVNPHSSYIEEEIYGCGYPFWFDGVNIRYINFKDEFIDQPLSYPQN